MRWQQAVIAGAAVQALCSATWAAPVTHGVAAGDVRSDSAVIWSRTDRPATMRVDVSGDRRSHAEIEPVQVTAESDFTGKIKVTGLEPGTRYRYKVRFTEGWGGRDEAVEGGFETAPRDNRPVPVTFAWGGDLAGQNVCRDATEGFPIFKAINRVPLDFFVGLGDMIYADGVCNAVGLYGNAQIPGPFVQAADKANYWAHWKYNREDNGYRALLARLPYYAIWDDHEVVNDFGPLHDTRTAPPYTPGVHLLPIGLGAFLDYNPIAEDANTPKRLYRSVRWGKHLEMFILDTRQYRDSNFEEDTDASPKTMLGREQVVWLKDAIKRSDATWKLIVSSVPMSIPTGSAAGRDGWANFQQSNGFERELLDVLTFMKDNGARNAVFITTDVHFAEVFRYAPFADDPGFLVHEVVTGPINAGLFPNRNFDTTLGAESLFFYGPAAPITAWEQAKPWMNFGLAHVDEHGRMTLSINDIAGANVYSLTLAPR